MTDFHGRTVEGAIGERADRLPARRRLPFPLVVLVLVLVASWVANPLLGRDPERTHITRQFTPPSREYPLGTDGAGRDVLARVLDAAKLDLGIAFGSTLLSLAVGALLGTVAGYVGGWVDRLLLLLLDLWQAIPSLLLALLVITVTGPSIPALVGVIAMVNIPLYARMIRAEMVPLRRSPLVEAAHLSGVAGWRLNFVYLLPRCLASAVAYLPVQAGSSIVFAAGFGFIGLGAGDVVPEWGAMISDGIADMLYMGAWWLPLAPGAALALIILMLYRLGDELSERLREGV